MVKNTVTEEMIDNLFKNSKTKVQTVEEKCTIVTVTLENGFVITESSACVDKANYDESVGRSICMQKVREKLWAYEGYCLQKELYGKNNGEVPKTPTAKERVGEEIADLREKIDRIDDVLYGKRYIPLNASERYLLDEQKTAMCQYLQILEIRLASWREIPKQETPKTPLVLCEKEKQ